MLSLVYMLMGRMAYCINKLLLLLYKVNESNIDGLFELVLLIPGKFFRYLKKTNIKGYIGGRGGGESNLIMKIYVICSH